MEWSSYSELYQNTPKANFYRLADETINYLQKNGLIDTFLEEYHWFDLENRLQLHPKIIDYPLLDNLQKGYPNENSTDIDKNELFKCIFEYLTDWGFYSKLHFRRLYSL